MTEEQIKRCAYLSLRKEEYKKALDALSNNNAQIIVSYWSSLISKTIYTSVCSTKNNIKELNLIVERFIKDKIQKIEEELREL